MPLNSTHDCTHEEDVAVMCIGTYVAMCFTNQLKVCKIIVVWLTPPTVPECKEGEVRLLGSPISSRGTVQLCANGRWGTVCADKSWDDRAARTVCTQKGFEGTKY